MNLKKTIKCAALVFGVIVIPLLYSYFYLGAFWDPYGTLNTLPVAVVNNDTGASINGKDRNLGSEAAKEIVKDGTLKFVSTDEKSAEAGVRGTKYYAVITFPSDFSNKVATASDKNKQVAEITYEANKKRNYIASQIMKNVVTKVEESVRGSVSEQIADTLSDKIKETPPKLTTLNNGLKTLSDGANTLSGGTKQLSAGQDKLTGGIASLNSGLTALNGGANTLNSGLASLQNGLTTIIGGTNKLSGAVSGNMPTLTSGINKLNGGAQSLLAQFSSGNGKTPTIYDGVTGVSNGMQQLYSQFSSGNGKTPTVYDGVTGVSNGMQQLYSQFSSGNGKTQTLYDGVTGVSSGTGDYVSAVDNMLYTMVTSNPNSKDVLAGYEQNLAKAQAAYASATDASAKAQYLAQVKMLANLVTVYSAALNPAVTNEQAFESALVNAASADSTKANVVASGAQLSAGTKQLAGEISDGGSLKTAVAQLAGASGAVASQFSDGGTLKTSVAKLAGASGTVASQFSDGGAFKSGMQQLAGGTAQLAGNTGSLEVLGGSMNKLSAALSAAKDGSSQLYAGSNKLSAGLSTAANGSGTLLAGSQKLSSADAQVNDGASKIAGGLNTAHSSVTDAINEINGQLSSLSGLGAYAKKPVVVDEKSLNPLPNYGTAFAPYFMSLSLYVGALLIFFGIYLDADDRIKVLSRHSDKKFIRVGAFVLIGIAQAIALALIVQFGLGLTVNNVPALYLSCILISLVFISIVEFLIVNLKDIGKFLAIGFLVLQLTSNGGTFPMETVPKFFNVLYPFMPMTYSVGLLKEVTCNFSNSAALHDTIVLIIVFAVFTGLTMLFSVTRKAKIKVQEILDAKN